MRHKTLTAETLFSSMLLVTVLYTAAMHLLIGRIIGCAKTGLIQASSLFAR
ncbi:hypothetical protein BDR03DRAFT_957662, partial [Suillus americanus]